ncbi:MAG: PAS domain S-box protein [Blastocatellia bacterium]|nr:PAS domain S-box protein [Blastocatellia bacterium]
MITGDIIERELEEILKAQDKSMIEGLSLSDENGIIFCTNLAEDKLFGRAQDDLISQQLIRQSNGNHEESKDKLQITGHWQGKFVNRNTDGRVLAKFAQITSVEYGGRKYWVRIQEDITERKRAEVAQARLAAIVESSDDAIIGTTLQGIITSWNKGAEKLFGYSEGEILGQPLTTLIPPERQGEEATILERLGRGERIDHYETVRLRKDGSTLNLSLTISPIKDSGGRIIGATEIARDIREVKLLDEALRRGEAEFRSLLESIPAAAYICNAEGLITDYNRRLVELLGRAPRLGDDRFSDSYKFSTPDGTPLRIPVIEEDTVYDNREGRAVVIERPDGKRVTALIHANPIRNESGMLIGAVNIFVDDSERRRFELEKEQLMKELAEREEAAHAEAQSANGSKSEFLSLVSHELRSPISSILVYSQLLRSTPQNASEIERTCEIIEYYARTQLGLVDDLLDTARVVSGKLQLDLQQIDVMPLLVNVHNVLRPAAEAKGIKLRVHYAKTSEVIKGDPVRLQQVIWNLLSNAIKFTAAGGRVELWLERNEENLYLIVIDSGVGIDPEFLPHIFDRFHQAEQAGSTRYGGLGLGLALTKHLVELHGGTIEAASEGLGLGSVFTVKLPVAKQVEVPQADTQVIRSEGAVTLTDIGTIKGTRILVADDQQEARVKLVEVLSKRGASVTAVASGIGALSILADPLGSERPDVFICNIDMPDEEGFAVLKRLRTLEASRGTTVSQRIPALAVTATGGEEEWLRARNAGFDICVPRPAEVDDLVRMIAGLARNRSRAA